MADALLSENAYPQTFVDENGRLMQFYIHVSDPQREKYAKVIEQAGGRVEVSEQLFHQSDAMIQLASVPWNDRPVVSFDFVNDSLKKGRPCYFEDYRIIPGLSKKRGLYDESLDVANVVEEAMVKRQRSKTTTKFTPEADNYIIEQVRLKPRLRTSHKFFEDISKHDLLKGHTGNSVRLRFRAHLEQRLTYVFKTDDKDNLVLDNNGQKIAIAVQDAKTMKNKFTAEEDYNLCVDVIKHVVALQGEDLVTFPNRNDDLLDESKFSVLISFFDSYARDHATHSSSSWRDRYRKFARAHGLQEYIREYNEAIKNGQEPKPMQNKTSRVKKEGKDNGVGVAPNRRLRIQEPMSHMDMAAHLLNLPHNHSQIDTNAATELASMAMSTREAALDEEISEAKNSNIDDALRGVGGEAGRVHIDDELSQYGQLHDASNAAIHPSFTGAGDDDDDFDLIDDQDPDSREINYVGNSAKSEDLVTDEFYAHQLPKKLVKAVKPVLKQASEDLGSLFAGLEKLGFKRRLTGHLIKSTGGDINRIIELVQHIAQIFNAGNLDDDIVKYVTIRDTDGFWTSLYDRYLKDGQIDKLAFMSKESIENRKAFIRDFEELGRRI